MESKQLLSRKLISIQENKLIREVDNTTLAEYPRLSRKQLLLDLEILPKANRRQVPKRVLVSIKSRAPVIKTIYIAEKSRFYAKGSDKSGARLAIGDHSSFTTHISEKENKDCGIETVTLANDQEETSSYDSKCSEFDIKTNRELYNTLQRSAEQCYVYTLPQLNMNISKIDAKTVNLKTSSSKADIGTFISTKNIFPENKTLLSNNILNKLHKRIDHLERKILRQEMVFHSIDPNIPLSSDEESEDMMETESGTGRAGCSYIEQYSHVPKTSAFEKYSQQTAPLSQCKNFSKAAATLQKEHNSEQYGRDFTTYDGITARGRRQCASVPCKRDDIPKTAAERVHKIRHKLNPVRDYRLMDTVHYLAQGEFAPRDDGIKLTPSREEVLSDIIWEDVCRTHWPNTRLGRRVPHPERCSTRCELQRLIDSLLRERVAHVERRRRRHYRIVKLNNRHESCRPVGKTGDIIVASHKNKQANEEREAAINGHNAAASTMISDRRWRDQMPRRSHRSHDRFNNFPDVNQREEIGCEECIPGPSYAFPRSPTNREATCCYHTSSPSKPERTSVSTANEVHRRNSSNEITSGSSMSISKPHKQQPRLIVKKDSSRRKYQSKEEPDLEHYILLPTLVVRTPSNVKRQKKFNELYHRILNVQFHNVQNKSVTPRPRQAVPPVKANDSPTRPPSKKNFGFNINITNSSTHYSTK